MRNLMLTTAAVACFLTPPLSASQAQGLNIADTSVDPVPVTAIGFIF